MSKRTTFTTISPLPPGTTREVVLQFLHDHAEMIDLNPLVQERHPIKPPAHATSEELHCVWYSMTDKISYLPGGLAAGDVTYTCAFHDLPTGLQTHCYAPAGLNIRDKWTLAGSLPGEPLQPVELGIGAPVTGLYIREDVDMRCNVLLTPFVKKTLKKSHAMLVERLKAKSLIAATATEREQRQSALVGDLSRSPLLSSVSLVSSSASSFVSTRSRGSDASSRPWTPNTSVCSSSASPRSRACVSPSPPSSLKSPPCAPSAAFSPRSQRSAASPPAPAFNYPASPPQNPGHRAYNQNQLGLVSPPKAGLLSPPAQHSQLLQPLSRTVSISSFYPDPLSVVSSPQPPLPTSPKLATAAPRLGTVRYRIAHRDYPQMNPYDLPLSPVPVTFATLSEPFRAELEC